jgi:hypothetical protein
VGEGPNHDGNGQITTSKLSTYAGMVSFLKDQDARQPAMELEVIGKTVKGRDIHLVKYLSDPAKPTILYLTQQHGNEQLTTEGALEFVKHLGTGKSGDVPDGVNILIVPMLNADGAMGDGNFPLDGYLASTWAAAPRPSAAMASPWIRDCHPAFRDAGHVGSLPGRLRPRAPQQRLPDQADGDYADCHCGGHRGRVHCRGRHLLLGQPGHPDLPPR